MVTKIQSTFTFTWTEMGMQIAYWANPGTFAKMTKTKGVFSKPSGGQIAALILCF